MAGSKRSTGGSLGITLGLALMLCSPVAGAAVEAALVGTWEAGAPGQTIAFEVQPDGRCVLAGRPAMCATQGRALLVQTAQGSLLYQWTVADGQLQLVLAGTPSGVMFRRVAAAGAGGTSPETGVLAATPRPSAGAAMAMEAGPERPRGTAPGFFRDAWGMGFDVPAAWRTAERNGQLLVVSDTEAGLMLVQFLPRSSRAELLAGYRAGLQDAGFIAMPITEATDFEVRGANALAGVMEGRSQDGATIRVRSIGVLSPFGGAAVVLALTTPAQFPQLQQRAEALARSIVFQSPPKAAPIAGQYQFVYVARTGSYSREASLTLCASGRYQSSGEMAGSGSGGSAVTGRGGAGSWSAAGDTQGGTLTLTDAMGGSRTLPYRVSSDPRDVSAFGPALRIGNDLYQKTGAGSC